MASPDAVDDPALAEGVGAALAEDTVRASLDAIITAAATQLVDNQVAHALPDYTARAFLLDVYACVQLHYVQRDTGDAGAASLNPLWTVEAEPAALQPDVWARGAVPVKRRVKMKDPMLEAMASGPGSVKQSDQLSARSGGSKTSKASKQTTATTAFKKPGKTALEGGGIPEEEVKVTKPFSIDRPVSATAAAREKIREETLAAMAKVAAAAKSKKDKAERAAAEEKARTEKLAAELKGKEYTYNRDGSIVIIGGVNADKLAKINLEPAAGLPPLFDAAAAAAAAGATSPKGGAAKDKKPAGKSKGKGAGAGDEEFRLGGGLSSVIDIIKMSGGVTLKEGGANKQGPPGIAAPASAALDKAAKEPLSPLGFGLSMTRRSYNEFIDTVQAQSAAFNQPSGATSTFNLSTNALSGMGGTQVQTTLNKMRSVDASSDPRAVAGLDDYPPMPSGARPPSQAGSGASPTALASPTRLPKISAVEMYNERIMEDASWGANPAPGAASMQFANMPAIKPSASTFAESLGVDRARLPRDRPFVSPTATNKDARQHLPAPLFPATSGHGFAPDAAGDSLASLAGSGRHASRPSLNTLAFDKTSGVSNVHTTNLTKAFLQKLQAPPV